MYVHCKPDCTFKRKGSTVFRNLPVFIRKTTTIIKTKTHLDSLSVCLASLGVYFVNYFVPSLTTYGRSSRNYEDVRETRYRSVFAVVQG